MPLCGEIWDYTLTVKEKLPHDSVIIDLLIKSFHLIISRRLKPVLAYPLKSSHLHKCTHSLREKRETIIYSVSAAQVLLMYVCCSADSETVRVSWEWLHGLIISLLSPSDIRFVFVTGSKKQTEAARISCPQCCLRIQRRPPAVWQRQDASLDYISKTPGSQISPFSPKEMHSFTNSIHSKDWGDIHRWNCSEFYLFCLHYFSDYVRSGGHEPLNFGTTVPNFLWLLGDVNWKYYVVMESVQ